MHWALYLRVVAAHVLFSIYLYIYNICVYIDNTKYIQKTSNLTSIIIIVIIVIIINNDNNN